MGWLLKLTGNPLTLLWIVGGAFVAGVASGGSGAWWVQGLRIDSLRGEYAERDAKAQAAATKAVQVAQTRARAAEQKAAADVAAISAKFEKEKANVAARTTKVIADLHTGNLVLRVQLDTPAAKPGDRGPTAETGTGAGECNGAAGGGLSQPTTATLSAADSEFLVAEASRADEVVVQLQACQAVVQADRP